MKPNKTALKNVFVWIINSSVIFLIIKHVLMSYQEERKFITYLTNINLRALLMSDGIINDLRGSVEQHSQKTPSPSVIPHQPNSYMLLDLQRISQAARRRYGAEGNTGKYGIYNLDLSWLLFCLSLKCHSSWSCIVLYFCDFSFFFSQRNKIYKLWTSPSLMLSEPPSATCQIMVLLGV